MTQIEEMTIEQRMKNVQRALHRMGEGEAFRVVNEATNDAFAQLPKDEQKALLAIMGGITDIGGLGKKSVLELAFRLGVLLLSEDEHSAERFGENPGQFNELPEWVLRLAE